MAVSLLLLFVCACHVDHHFCFCMEYIARNSKSLCTVSNKRFLAGTLDFVCAYHDFYCVPLLYWKINVVSVGEGRLLLLLAVVVTENLLQSWSCCKNLNKDQEWKVAITGIKNNSYWPQ
jgi:hypothetical protein